MTNYKCVVTLRNGAHKIVRMTKDVMAHLVSEFRKCQRDIFADRKEIVIHDVLLLLNDVKMLLFINEYTGERLEIA